MSRGSRRKRSQNNPSNIYLIYLPYVSIKIFKDFSTHSFIIWVQTNFNHVVDCILSPVTVLSSFIKMPQCIVWFTCVPTQIIKIFKAGQVKLSVPNSTQIQGNPRWHIRTHRHCKVWTRTIARNLFLQTKNSLTSYKMWRWIVLHYWTWKNIQRYSEKVRISLNPDTLIKST